MKVKRERFNGQYPIFWSPVPLSSDTEEMTVSPEVLNVPVGAKFNFKHALKEKDEAFK